LILLVAAIWRRSCDAFTAIRSLKVAVSSGRVVECVGSDSPAFSTIIQQQQCDAFLGPKRRHSRTPHFATTLGNDNSSGAPSSSDNGGEDGDDKSKDNKKKTQNKRPTGNEDKESGPTLYDILQVPSSATREEIKTSFIKLAKITHPDATLASNPNAFATGEGSGTEVAALTTTYTFSEISKTYKQLMDPLSRKRYDRELVAEAFKRDVERAATEMGSVAGPQLKSILDNLAMPMFRRTTATTSAVVGEVFKDFQESRERQRKGRSLEPSSNLNATSTAALVDEAVKAYQGENSQVNGYNDARSEFDLRRMLSTAVEAGRNAGKTIDRLEQAEKSRELENR
jgi:curved DNA-binding protein CbpA